MATPKQVDEKLEELEGSLKEVNEKRGGLQDEIKKVQEQLDTMVRRGPRRPRETIPELDDRLKKLERERTIVSIPLKQEKEILRQMAKVKATKVQVDEFNVYDKHVKVKRNELSALRDSLKLLSTQISELRMKLSMFQTAKKLGCSVEELLGMQVECPTDKLGMIIGKKGQNVKQLQQRQNVSIDIERKDGAVRILGNINSIDATASDLGKVLAIEEISIELPKNLSSYLTAKGITALLEIRARHPDVNLDVSRKAGVARLRGVPEDIESAKDDLMSVEIIAEKLKITSDESAIVVGKQGATIDRLVLTHQVAINVSSKNDKSDATVDLIGSISSVKEALEEIELMLSQHKEEVELISIDPVAKDCLLINKGTGIQKIFKRVNDACRDILPGLVSVSFEENNVKIKAKSLVIRKAVDMVAADVRELERSIVRLTVDPHVIPVVIGKGGEGIKKLTEGAPNVTVEVDRPGRQVILCSQDPDELVQVTESVQKLITDNVVRLIRLDPTLYQAQFRNLIRSKTWKEIGELVHISGDDDNTQIVLRGKPSDLAQASTILLRFLEENYQDQLNVAEEDVGALLRGGKKSKIEAFSKEFDVRLNSDTEKGIVVIIGRQQNVANAKVAIDKFLHGGSGMVVVRIVLDDPSIAAIIGKGGSTKAIIEGKFPDVTMTVHQQHIVALRGPTDQVALCRKHVARLVTTAFVTEKFERDDFINLDITPPKIQQMLKGIPVQTSYADSEVTVRGLRADTLYASAILKQAIFGGYECRFPLEASHFHTMKKLFREDAATVESVEKTGVKLKADHSTSSISLRGSPTDVLKAKTQIVQLLEKHFGDTFVFVTVPQSSVAVVGQSSFLGDISEDSGAYCYLDRDLRCVFVCATDASSAKAGAAMLVKKMSSLDSMVHKIELGTSAPWIMPRIIGQGGKKIKSLRKTLECKIDLQGTMITIVSQDPAKLQKAKAHLDTFIANEMSGVVFVELLKEDMPVFIGSRGSHIQEFEKKNGVKVQALKEQNQTIRITGEPNAVKKAKKALDRWVFVRHNPGASLPKELEAEERVVLQYEPYDEWLLRRLIGKNARRLKSLRKECNCTVDVNVESHTITLESDDKEVLEKAKAHVEQVVEQERTHSIYVELGDERLPSFIGTKGAHVQEFESKYNVQVTSVKDGKGTIRVVGSLGDLEKAKVALDEWRGVTKENDEDNVASQVESPVKDSNGEDEQASADAPNVSIPAVETKDQEVAVPNVTSEPGPSAAPMNGDSNSVEKASALDTTISEPEKVPVPTNGNTSVVAPPVVPVAVKPKNSWASIVTKPKPSPNLAVAVSQEAWDATETEDDGGPSM